MKHSWSYWPKIMRDEISVQRFVRDENTFIQNQRYVSQIEYNDKITITGDLVRHHHYEVPVVTLTRKRMTYTRDKDNPKSKISLYRTRMNLVDTINTNKTKYTKFLTLTYANTQLDREQAVYDLKQFSKRFKRVYGFNLKYIGLLERQKERGEKEGNIGSLHFHLVIFLDVFIPYKELNLIWDKGFSDIKQVKDGDVGRYIAKYLTEDGVNDITRANKKILFRSKGLLKPIVLKGTKALAYLYQNNGEVLYNTTYPSKHNGTITMTEYKNDVFIVKKGKLPKQKTLFFPKQVSDTQFDDFMKDLKTQKLTNVHKYDIIKE